MQILSDMYVFEYEMLDSDASKIVEFSSNSRISVPSLQNVLYCRYIILFEFYLCIGIFFHSSKNKYIYKLKSKVENYIALYGFLTIAIFFL